MKWYIAKRLLQIIPVILGVTIIAFALIHLAPGDPARTMLGQHATQTEIDEIRAKYGLDQPLYVQYFIWLGDVLHGDLGRSILTHEQVTTEIGSRFPNTIELAIAAMIFAVLIGVVAGLIVGPVGLGLITNAEEIALLSELGIIFLLFSVGLELDFRRIENVGFATLVGGTVQIILTFAAGFFAAVAFGMTSMLGIYIGLMMAISSTMIVAKVLTDKDELGTLHGRKIGRAHV
jgi:ABC-type antimicrobial peptide transport system permease subunit